MKQITKNEMLIKPGGIWYLQTKKQTKNKGRRESNEICFLVFKVSAANVVHSTYWMDVHSE